MANDLPPANIEKGGNQQTSPDSFSDNHGGLPDEKLALTNVTKRKKTGFPNSKRVDFAAALGLVIWVWSEMLETHNPSKLCVQWLILVIFYIPVCYYFSTWLNKARVGHLIFYLLCFITGVFAYKNTFFPAFSIIPREQYVEMKTPRHFLKWNTNNRAILSPINVIMLAQFTNLRDEAMVINSYQFEGRTTNGTWEIMPTIDMTYGSMISFFGTNWGTQGFGICLGPLKEGDVMTSTFGDDLFPGILAGKTIAAGGTISGMIFLEGTKHGFDGSIRCRIQDSVDREFVEIVSPMQQTNHLQTAVSIGTTMGPAMIDKEDVKSFPKVPWSHEWGY